MADWRDHAACRDHDPEMFFPVGPLVDASAAKAVCRHCPVIRECLDYALTTGQDDGVWGGKTSEERRALPRGSRTRPQDPARKSRQGRTTALTDTQIADVLALLDDGVPLPEMQRRTGLGREVGRRLWRQHRSTPNPPGRPGRNRPTSEKDAS